LYAINKIANHEKPTNLAQQALFILRQGGALQVFGVGNRARLFASNPGCSTCADSRLLFNK